MCERCGIGNQANGVSCGVVECVKRNTLRWFGHIEGMRNEEFVNKVYMIESVGPDSRGRPPGRWRDRVREYMCERASTGGQGRGGVFSAVTTPSGGRSRRERGIRAIDR